MEKKDWIRTVADVGSAENVWYENVSADGGFFPLSVPESGMYRVILVKIGKLDSTEKPRQKSARELIGYGRKFDPVYRSTAEVMRELREGEEV
jgi:hypothetical protein